MAYSQPSDEQPLIQDTTAPYLDNPEVQHTPAEEDASGVTLPSSEADMNTLKPEGRKGDLLGLGLVAGGCGLLVIGTCIAILSNNPGSLGLFAFHPPLQTAAVALFSFGILTLQPTSQPKTKQAGLVRHQLIILGLGLPCITLGTLLMIWNKTIHEAPHFTTWHATFGIIAIAWMLIQMLLGAGSVWFGGSLFGGGAKAKSVWKYHRASGYLLLPFFLVTIMIGGGWSAWTTTYIATVPRILIWLVAPAAIFTGLWSRARLSKMQFF